MQFFDKRILTLMHQVTGRWCICVPGIDMAEATTVSLNLSNSLAGLDSQLGLASVVWLARN